MPTFSQTVLSDDRIKATPEEVWAVLVDPVMLAKLTPLVDTITVEGERWTWRLTTVNGLGLTAAPEFTTVMRLGEGRRIDFEPDPQSGERATAKGFLTVDVDGDETILAIDVTASVDLPLPRMMSKPVRSIMFSTMKAGGSRFARNLLRHLGNPSHRGLDVRGVTL
ncbi:hypothetical protein BH23ACT9_BH23ACT9_16170 [soil metagenome]